MGLGPGFQAGCQWLGKVSCDQAEDQDLLPPVLSVEGGAECETKQVKLDAGKAKCKLRATENKPMQLRVVPLDRSGRQEAWVPEFLFTVDRITGDEVAAEKWWKAVVTP